jgi:hypothetical protein
MDRIDRMHQQKGKEKDPESYEIFEKKQNQKRELLNRVRAPISWNFFDDAMEGLKVKHVLRWDANPRACYQDGRVD